MLNLPPARQRVTLELWRVILGLLDRDEVTKTLSLIDREMLRISRSVLFTVLEVDALALIELQHLQVETNSHHRQLTLHLDAVKTLRLFFSNVSVSELYLLSTFLLSTGARPTRLEVHGFFSMDGSTRIAIQQSPVVQALRRHLHSVIELRIVSPRGWYRDGALWLWMCPQIQQLSGGAPSLERLSPAQRRVQKLRPLLIDDTNVPALHECFIDVTDTFRSSSGGKTLWGCILSVDRLIVMDDPGQEVLLGLRQWREDGMTFRLRHIQLQAIVWTANEGCPALKSLLASCSTTLVTLKVLSVKEKGQIVPL